MTPATDAHGGWTYSEYARLPDDGNHYEVIDGEVCVTPAAGLRHQDTVGTLYLILREYVERTGVGRVYVDVDLLFQAGQFLRPDLVFVPTASLAGLTDRGVESPPGLVVEVLSPHSERIDRVKKPPRYREFGVPEYWVVDPDRRVVEVYRTGEGSADPEAYPERVSWRPMGAREALEIEVPRLFRE